LADYERRVEQAVDDRTNRSSRSRDQSGASGRKPPARSPPSLSHSTSCTAPTATGSKIHDIGPSTADDRRAPRTMSHRYTHFLIDVPIAGDPDLIAQADDVHLLNHARTRSSRRSARRPPGGSSPTA